MKDNIGIVGGYGFVGTRLSELLMSNESEHRVFDNKADINSHDYLDVEDLTSLESLKNSSLIINLFKTMKRSYLQLVEGLTRWCFVIYFIKQNSNLESLIVILN